MLRTEVTVGGCCWAVEPTIRRSLFYEANAKILCFCGQRSHPQVFAERSGAAEGQDRGARRDPAGGQRGECVRSCGETVESTGHRFCGGYVSLKLLPRARQLRCS